MNATFNEMTDFISGSFNGTKSKMQFNSTNPDEENAYFVKFI